jgi:Flp pilus assembly secretin CpaC
MTPSLANASTPSLWRRAGASLALAAALAFTFQPTLVMAQAADSDNQPPPKAQPKPHKAKPAKKASRTSPTDNISDDLNRREAERAAGVVREMSAAPAALPANTATTAATAAPQPLVPPAAAAAAAALGATPVEAKKTTVSEPPTVAAIPPRPPIVSASLTPTVNTQPGAEPAAPAPVAVEVTPKQGTAPKIQEAQARPPAPGPAPGPAPTPAPVPVQPPSAGNPPPLPTVTGPGAPSRAFAQSQLVPTQQPTLNLEVGKGTAIKLPGPATTVFVAAPDIADVQVKSPAMIYVFAKKPGDTVLYAVDDQDRVLLNTIVSVNSPFSRMKMTLDQQHPGNGVTFENQNDSIVISGTVRSAVIAEDARKIAVQYTGANSKIINNIRIDAPTQVQVRVKVAEVRRDALTRMGVNWQKASLFGLSGLSYALSTISSTGGLASGTVTYNSSDLNGIIDFLATNNQATILAEPNLVAMSGETASFLAGGEIPILVPQGGLTSTITVQYKQFGISLAMTPTIIGERVNLKVAPEVSEISAIGSISVPITPTATVSVPGIQTRRATTTIELGSGQSFAIAGLMHQTSQQDIVKMPWLGDIPVLGTLFKSDAYQRSETELVIIITPYFVEPTSGRLRTPLSNRVPPTDADRLVLQRFNHPTPPVRITGGGQQYAGPSAGFKLD